ncbi:MAG TPA: SemiSWEET family transporter [Polyangiaceae bacterium]|nr:SemiSWEET family transporter [Polyangiaceae bacterium]
MVDAIGWASSVILLATISKQIHKQWRARSSEGVSKWLFVGQTAASLGFTVYSWLVHNWVFVVTNALLLLAGITGFVITLHFRRDASRSTPPGAPANVRASS